MKRRFSHLLEDREAEALLGGANETLPRRQVTVRRSRPAPVPAGRRTGARTGPVTHGFSYYGGAGVPGRNVVKACARRSLAAGSQAEGDAAGLRDDLAGGMADARIAGA